jgi:hypothetical protein
MGKLFLKICIQLNPIEKAEFYGMKWLKLGLMFSVWVCPQVKFCLSDA